MAAPTPTRRLRLADVALTPAKRAKVAGGAAAAESAPVELTVHAYCDSAGLALEGWPADFALYQVQVEHRARPSLTFNMLHSFRAFLAAAHAQDASHPATLPDLEANRRVRLVLSPPEDRDRESKPRRAPAMLLRLWAKLLLFEVSFYAPSLSMGGFVSKMRSLWRLDNQPRLLRLREVKRSAVERLVARGLPGPRELGHRALARRVLCCGQGLEVRGRHGASPPELRMLSARPG